MNTSKATPAQKILNRSAEAVVANLRRRGFDPQKHALALIGLTDDVEKSDLVFQCAAELAEHKKVLVINTQSRRKETFRTTSSAGLTCWLQSISAKPETEGDFATTGDVFDFLWRACLNAWNAKVAFVRNNSQQINIVLRDGFVIDIETPDDSGFDRLAQKLIRNSFWDSAEARGFRLSSERASRIPTLELMQAHPQDQNLTETVFSSQTELLESICAKGLIGYCNLRFEKIKTTALPTDLPAKWQFFLTQKISESTLWQNRWEAAVIPFSDRIDYISANFSDHKVIGPLFKNSAWLSRLNTLWLQMYDSVLWDAPAPTQKKQLALISKSCGGSVLAGPAGVYPTKLWRQQWKILQKHSSNALGAILTGNTESAQDLDYAQEHE